MKKGKKVAVLAALAAAFALTVWVKPEAEALAGQEKIRKLQAEEFFTSHDGTFVLHDVKKDQSYVYNEERAMERTAPESTFKVPNALIGLQTGAVEDEYDIKYWDGTEREIPVWNQDHTLGSGMRYSVVWYYQAMARDIGEQRMKEWITKISYGNKDISGGIDQFWLSSTLKISPMEQVEFMKALHKEKLPFDKDVMKTVKRMMVQEEGDRYTIYAKTGQGSGKGWYTGIIESGKRTFTFAAHIDGTSADAKEITRSILTKHKLITQ
ncbi:class D beta-lactamase [Bacillus mangrovi]|uniref:Beta-lactamase n=1 Tax=Metabacillus mangrovi TaxID=1491830 RepID=A0A7X2S8T5_9BACI|nr:class D beta-lactamase [Metabacillus mangrovi]MTH55403.1 class D beta-lactamase [Metabacillus mangrovi]